MVGLLFLFLFSVASTAVAAGPNEVRPGAIWSVSEDRFVSEAVLLERLADADVVLLGETHDNPRHHTLQAKVVGALAERGTNPAVVFEMLQRPQQEDVDAARQRAPENVDELADAVSWEESGWPAWEEYRPIFAAAYRHDLPIVAANLPREQARAIARSPEDVLTAADRERLFLDVTLPAPEHSKLERIIGRSHCGMLPASRVSAMVTAQRARDGALVRATLEALQDQAQAVLITGNGHARRDHGVPWLLEQVAPEVSSVAVSFRSAATPDEERPYDYVWFTPPGPPSPDPCAAFGSDG